MKLLVTGGCGFLGSNLAAHAMSNSIELCVYDSLYRHGASSNLEWLRSQGKFHFVQEDIRNPDAVEQTIREFRPDTIFHLAGQVAMTTSIEDPRMDFEVNAGGTLNVLEAARKNTPTASVIYSSTNKVYGDLEQYSYSETETRYQCTDFPKGFNEHTPLEFHSPYGCSKGSADQYMLDYHRIFGLNTVVFRHSSMYGGRQFATYDQGWVGWFCQMAAETRRGLRKEAFTISGNGKQVRDVLHARDMTNLYFSAVEHIGIAAGNAFNVGGGVNNSLSLLELFALLEEFTGVALDYTRLPPRESDQRVFIADIDKASSMLDWQPAVDCREGVSDMLDWVDRTLQTTSP
jgi:CDP-paratose 2-epimerase